jgi:F-type H+-transporting ATPase subunit delta
MPAFVKPYVDALFAVAGPGGVEPLVPELDAFARMLGESAKLRAVLQHPGLDRKKKDELVGALAKKAGLGTLGTRLVHVLSGNRRLTRLADVVAAVHARLDREGNVVEARVRTAAALTAPETEALVRTLEARTKKKVRLQSTTEPALLGGFVVRLGSEVYDASLATRLARVRAALHGSTG